MNKSSLKWLLIAALLVPSVYHVTFHMGELFATGDALGTIQRDLLRTSFTDTLHILIATTDFTVILILAIWVIRLERKMKAISDPKDSNTPKLSGRP